MLQLLGKMVGGWDIHLDSKSPQNLLNHRKKNVSLQERNLVDITLTTWSKPTPSPKGQTDFLCFLTHYHRKATLPKWHSWILWEETTEHIETMGQSIRTGLEFSKLSMSQKTLKKLRDYLRETKMWQLSVICDPWLHPGFKKKKK